MKLRILIFAIILFNAGARAQVYVMGNEKVMNQIEEGLDSLYNYSFDASDSLFAEFTKHHPEHPFPLLYKAITTYLQYFPVTPYSEYHDEYISLITKAIEKADILLKKDKKNAEAIFLSLMGRLLLMQYYADNEMSSKVVPYVRTAYKLTKKGFDLTEVMSDFNFSTGLYNYYREAYPEKHPVYKPIAYFFPNGDKVKGIKQLEYNNENGIFLDAESLSFLVYISIYFEENPQKAAKYTKQLYKKYPKNLLYASYRIQALFLEKKYDKAIPIIEQLATQAHSNDFFKMMALVYQGIVEERHLKDLDKAENTYKMAIKLSEKYGSFGERGAAYAYFGLSRIHKSKDSKLSSNYRKKAIESASYPNLSF